ncbi:uncharacterized protein [Rutidosis leptorrhynchoides]|uniref:uncharacterized protein n=1 Tax=Rutidosis leptorrhynchoides TaxID=125765 RepID=UPI003A9995BF
MAWVKWDSVLASFEHGGLNVGSLKAFNLALLLKWKWWYHFNVDDLWVKLMKSIHGEHFDNTFGNSLWCSIVASCNKTVSDRLLPQDVIKLEVGNSTNVSFWHDRWCGSSTLESRFNRLYYLDINKHDSVADKWVNGEWQWVWSREDIGGHNMALLDDLLSVLHNVFFSDREDRWVFTLNSDGIFTVKDTRVYIDRSTLPNLQVVTTWAKQLPKKVNIFLWRFKSNSLPLR